jgi:hypothetical protein
MGKQIQFSPCRCPACRDFKVKLPDRCPCRECQPGPGIPPKPGLREILAEAGITAAEPHYCVRCNNVVLVTSVQRGDHWVHVCKTHGHGWRTEKPL